METTNETAAHPAVASEPAQAGHPPGAVTHPARQPLVDAEGLLCGFELVTREPLAGDGAAAADADPASRRAASDAALTQTLALLGASGVHAALGGHRGYLSVNRALLMADDLARISPERYFFQLPPDIAIDGELTARLVALHGKRYRFVLDRVSAPDATFAKLLPYVYAVKIDVAKVAPDLLAKLADALKSAGKILIALGVDSHETFERAKAARFDVFQGYFFARADRQASRRASAPRQALLNLLRLLSADPSVAQLEAELKLNPVLVMHIMRLANSGEASIGRKVATLRDAINATGTNRIARWTQLLLYADGRKVRLEDDPLVQLAATRARFMEMAAAHLTQANRKVVDAAFLTGVFSLVDAVFGDTLEATLDALMLAGHIRAAILRHEGLLGTLLAAVQALERADWAALEQVSAALAPFTPPELAELAIASAAWASAADQHGDNAGLERVQE
jgi:c-di-GMP-related signal transduction protein